MPEPTSSWRSRHRKRPRTAISRSPARATRAVASREPWRRVRGASTGANGARRRRRASCGGEARYVRCTYPLSRDAPQRQRRLGYVAPDARLGVFLAAAGAAEEALAHFIRGRVVPAPRATAAAAPCRPRAEPAKLNSDPRQHAEENQSERRGLAAASARFLVVSLTRGCRSPGSRPGASKSALRPSADRRNT